jgi:Uma2 family endonuclease
MEQLATKKIYSLEEYFALETALKNTRHEFLEGEIYQMAGAQPEHSLVVVNLIREISNKLIKKKSKCVVYNNDQRVQAEQPAPNKAGYFYPDLVVVCGKPMFNNDNPPTLLNPTFVIEVLSESTMPYDLGKKLDYYRAAPTIQGVLFARCDKKHLSLYARNGDAWVLRDFTEKHKRLDLTPLALQIPIAEIYRDVELPS